MTPRTERSRRGGTALGLLLLGIQLGVVHQSLQEKTLFGKVGGDVTLTCNKNKGQREVKWEKDNVAILSLRAGLSMVVRTTDKNTVTYNLAYRSELNTGTFAMRVKELQVKDTGVYQCVGKVTERVQLVVVQINPSEPQPLLVAESLTLRLVLGANISTLNPSITWSDPKNRDVMGTGRSVGVKNNGQTFEMDNLQLEDQGVWKCEISAGEPPLELMYEVKVAGFLTDVSVPVKLYSLINVSVPLPCVFNFNIRSPPVTDQLKVKRGGLYRSGGSGELGQQKLALNVSKDGICWNSEHTQRPRAIKPADLSVTLPKVQFGDGGWYTVLVEFEQKKLKKKFQLIVLRVSASPEGPVPPESKVALNCEVSDHSTETQLRWTHVNGSRASEHKADGVGSFQIDLDMTPEHFGLWRCSIYTGVELKHSVDYRLEERRSALFDWWIWAAGGAAALVLLLVIVCAVICAARSRRQRRQARRVAWLMQQTTCQCKHKLLNEPHHA